MTYQHSIWSRPKVPFFEPKCAVGTHPTFMPRYNKWLKGQEFASHTSTNASLGWWRMLQSFLLRSEHQFWLILRQFTLHCMASIALMITNIRSFQGLKGERRDHNPPSATQTLWCLQSSSPWWLKWEGENIKVMYDHSSIDSNTFENPKFPVAIDLGVGFHLVSIEINRFLNPWRHHFGTHKLNFVFWRLLDLNWFLAKMPILGYIQQKMVSKIVIMRSVEMLLPIGTSLGFKWNLLISIWTKCNSEI